MIDYGIRLIRRFREERFVQLAASLSFTTLLSLVPMVAVIIAIGQTFPIFAAWVGQLDNFIIANLLPEKAGDVVASYAYRFSRQASRLTAPGLGMLVVASLVLMFSIERAFNQLWRTGKARSWGRRAVLYVFALFCFPLLAGAVLAVTGFVVGVATTLTDRDGWGRYLVAQGSALALLCALFSLMYFFVPAAKVRAWHAIVGGVIAAAGVTALQRLFTFGLGQVTVYKTLYGAFVALPIFLIWLYLCWAVVLVGALVAANFSAPQGGGKKRQP